MIMSWKNTLERCIGRYDYDTLVYLIAQVCFVIMSWKNTLERCIGISDYGCRVGHIYSLILNDSIGF